jgi:cytochrome c551/c552
MFLKIFNIVILFLLILSVKNVFAANKSDILKGKAIVIRSGCVRCHSFVKGRQIKGYDTLADFGDRHLSIKQTEKAIRSCRMDPYCSQILTNRQVRYVAYYLNSLK